MIEWIDAGDVTPPINKPLLCHCPEWCDIGYVVATWNGESFEDEIRGEDINDYVEKWAIFFEAD